MNKTKQKKVDSEEVLVMGLGGWLGCECQNYLLWAAQVGRDRDGDSLECGHQC